MSEDKEVDNLRAILDPPSSLPIEKLIPPKGVSRQNIEAVTITADDKIYSYEELVAKVISMPVLPKITTGMKCIDDLLDGGHEPGELIVLAAYPKAGKTQMSLTLTYNQALAGVPSLWFTLEMQWHEIMRKFMLMDKEYQSTKIINQRPIFLPVDTRLMTLEKMRIQIAKAIKDHNIKMVYVDHLQELYTADDIQRKNISLYVGELVKELKRIAKDLQVTIMLISHIAKGDPTITPTSGSIRDSGMIVANADLVFIMWRERLIRDKKKVHDDNEEIYSDRTFLSLEENRRNGNTKRMLFGMNKGMFVPYEEYTAAQWDKHLPEEDFYVQGAAEIFNGEVID